MSPALCPQILDLLTGFLGELGTAGESAAEFLSLYQSLIAPAPWKQYLAVRGVLLHLATLLTGEIQELHRLEETTLTSDLAQGIIKLTNHRYFGSFSKYHHSHKITFIRKCMVTFNLAKGIPSVKLPLF